MTRYTSGNKLNLKLGIESFSEDLLTLEVIGNSNIGGDINVSAGNSITAPEYYGDGSNLTGISLDQVSDAIGGITVQEEGVDVGTTNGIININFVSSNLTATGSGIGATITLTDTPTFATISGDLTGTATTATKLETSRNFNVSGDVATALAVPFDGTGDVDLAVTLSNNFSANTSGIITAFKFSGDGSELTNLTAGQVGALAGVTIREEGVVEGSAGSVGDINFVSSNLTATASGIGATITLTDTPTFSTITGDLTGTATTATKLETSRNFSVSGDVATASNVSFDGTADVDLAVTLSNDFSANTSGIITAFKFSGGDINVSVGNSITAPKYYGDGSNLTNLTPGQVGALAGVTIREEGTLEGSAGSVGDINFVGNYMTATASGAGATITLSDITLGTDTIGNYVATISGTANEIEVTNGSSAGSNPTIGLPNNVTISNDLSVSGNLNVTGTLTYEDVTNVDSIGIVTARSGIDAEGDINVSAGNSITAPKYYGDGSGLTGLSAGQVGAMTDLVSDTSPELGGDLDLNNFDITGNGNINITGVITATSTVHIGSNQNTDIALQADGNVRVGFSTTSNYIAFHGTWWDGTSSPGVQQVASRVPYTHTYVGERIYNYPEDAELLLYKGNDNHSQFGTDRIRYLSGMHEFQLINDDDTVGTFEEVGNFAGITTALLIDGIGETGVSTVTVFGDFVVNGDFESDINVSTGNSITAPEYYGDGSNLTGLTAGQVGAMADLVSDTSPELGGDLDLNNFDITGDGNININGSITATSFVGTASTATTVTISSNNDSTAYRVPYTSSTSGNVSLYVDNNDGMTYNPGTNTLFAGFFSGNGSNLTSVDADTVDGIDSTGFLQTFYETAINSPDASGGTWTTSNSSSSWGDPKFNNSFDQFRYADGSSAYVQYNIPSGYKSCWISQLQWNSGGYADCYGVQSDGGLVFLRRINTRQLVKNSNEGNPDQHDGMTITHIGSGLEHYTAIKIQNQSGRIHLTGIAWTKNENVGYEGTGMVHPAQISHQGSGSGLDADTLDGEQLSDSATANTVVSRDGSADINCRLLRSNFANSSYINGALAFRTNNSSDNYVRFISDTSQIRTYLGVTATASDTNYLSSNDTDIFEGQTSGRTLRFRCPDGRNAGSTSASLFPLEVYQNSNVSNSDAAMTFHISGRYATYFGLDRETNDLFTGGWSDGSTKHRIWHEGNQGAGSGLDADTLDGIDSTNIQQSLARIAGWVPAYSDATESNVVWNFTEDAVEIKNASDNTGGAAYKAMRMKSGDKVRIALQLKGSVADSNGVYIRIYFYNGDLPDGKTHVSNSATYTLVQEDSSGDTGWWENNGITTSYVGFERTYTATADGYMSIVVLNWSGYTGSIYLKAPDIQFESLASAPTAADSQRKAIIAAKIFGRF